MRDVNAVPPALPGYLLVAVILGGLGLAHVDASPPAAAQAPAVEPAPAILHAPVLRAVENTDEGGCQLSVEVQDAGRGLEALLSLHQVGPKGTLEARTAVTDGRGLHRFSDLSPGTYHLSARASGHALGAAPVWTCQGDEGRAFFHLDLAPGGSLLQGRVTGFGGVPAPGTEVLIDQPARHEETLVGVAHVPVADDGTFEVLLAPGEYRLLALAPHHTAQVQQIRVGDEPSSTTKIALDWKPEASGQVLGPDLQPVAGAQVFLGPMYDPRLGATSVTTDDEGRFTLAILPGRPLTLAARHDATGGFDVVKLPAARSVEGHRGVTLVLQPGRDVGGFVQRNDGRAHAYGEVTWRVRSLGLVGTAKADGEGRFSIRGLPMDDVELWPAGSAIGAWGGAVAEAGTPLVLLTFQPQAYAQR